MTYDPYTQSNYTKEREVSHGNAGSSLYITGMVEFWLIMPVNLHSLQDDS